MRKFRSSAARTSNLARHSKGERPTVCMADALELLRPLQPTVLECLGWVAATQLLSTRSHALGADFVETMLMKLEQHDVTLDLTRRPSAGNLIQQLYAAVCQEMLMFNPPAHAPSPYGVFLDGIPSSPVMCPRLGSPVVRHIADLRPQNVFRSRYFDPLWHHLVRHGARSTFRATVTRKRFRWPRGNTPCYDVRRDGRLEFVVAGFRGHLVETGYRQSSPRPRPSLERRLSGFVEHVDGSSETYHTRRPYTWPTVQHIQLPDGNH